MPVLCTYAPSEPKARRLSVDGGKTEVDEATRLEAKTEGEGDFLKDGRATQRGLRGGKNRGAAANNSRERPESQLARYAPGSSEEHLNILREI